MGLAAALPVAALIAIATWWTVSPHMAVHGLRQAALSGDSVAIVAAVDFVELRASLKQQLRARLVAGPAAASDPLAAIGADLAIAFVDPMVDMAITPQTLHTAMRWGGEWSAPPALSAIAALAAPDIQITRDGLNRFDVTLGSTAAGTPVAIFQRDGLTWKLVDIRLPAARA